MTDHPITPPFELKLQWRGQAPRYCDGRVDREKWLIDRAAQWGYDQRGEVNEAELQQARDEELEACCEWMADETPADYIDALRAARRPKPAISKEQALARLEFLEKLAQACGHDPDDTIFRALEALPDD